MFPSKKLPKFNSFSPFSALIQLMDLCSFNFTSLTSDMLTSYPLEICVYLVFVLVCQCVNNSATALVLSFRQSVCQLLQPLQNCLSHFVCFPYTFFGTLEILVIVAVAVVFVSWCRNALECIPIMPAVAVDPAIVSWLCCCCCFFPFSSFFFFSETIKCKSMVVRYKMGEGWEGRGGFGNDLTVFHSSNACLRCKLQMDRPAHIHIRIHVLGKCTHLSRENCRKLLAYSRLFCFSIFQVFFQYHLHSHICYTLSINAEQCSGPYCEISYLRFPVRTLARHVGVRVWVCMWPVWCLVMELELCMALICKCISVFCGAFMSSCVS